MTRIGKVIPKLPDEYNTQIGAIIMKWATLEFQMMVVIWRAMGLDNVEGRVLTAGMSTEVLLGILANLPRKWITDSVIKEELSRLVKAVRDRKNFRNNIARGIWTLYKDDPLPHLNFMKQGDQRIMPDAQAVTPSDLKGFSISLDQMNQLADQIVRKLGTGDVVAPLPDIHGEQNPAGLPTEIQNSK